MIPNPPIINPAKIRNAIICANMSISYFNIKCVRGDIEHLNNPQGMVQWQNAIHLPYDIWMNVDMAWESAGDDRNMHRKSCSYLNAKLYKAFFNNSFSVSVEANDIFNKRNYGVTSFSRDITRYVCVTDLSRSFYLTLQYSFNSSRDRYKGRGAGANEKNRF